VIGRLVVVLYFLYFLVDYSLDHQICLLHVRGLICYVDHVGYSAIVAISFAFAGLVAELVLQQ
jgi:hypothetical protein